MERNDYLYEIGDRVVMVDNTVIGNGNLKNGAVGTVVYVENDHYYEEGAQGLNVYWDEKFQGGHTCDGKCPTGHGWNVDARTVTTDVRAYDEIDAADESAVLDFLIA